MSDTAEYDTHCHNCHNPIYEGEAVIDKVDHYLCGRCTT